MTSLTERVKKGSSVLQTFLLIVTPAATVVLAYVWYRKNIWRPDVQLLSADYQQGTAIVKVDDKEITIRVGSTVSVGGGFGIRMGGSQCGSVCNYSRVELVKDNLVYKTL